MLCSRFLREPHLLHHGRIYQASEAMYQKLVGLYERSLLFVLRHRLVTLLFSFVVLGATVYLFNVVPKGFIPAEDRDMILVSTETAQDISWPSLVDHGMKLAEIAQKDPNVDRFMLDVDTIGLYADCLETPQGRAALECRTSYCRTPSQTQFGARHQGHADQPARRSMSAAVAAAVSIR